MAGPYAQPDNNIPAAMFINRAARDLGTPANDTGRTPILEDDQKIDEAFLRSAIRRTASENITSVQPVGVDMDGKVARAFRAWASDAQSIPANFSTIRSICEIGTNKWVIIFGYVPSTWQYYAVVATIDSNSHRITFGARVSTIGSEGAIVGVCKLDTDKFLVGATEDGQNDVILQAATVSGTTISFGSAVNVAVGTYLDVQLCQIDTNKFAVYANNSGSTGQFHGFGTVSGTVPSMTASTTTAITNFSNTTPVIKMVKIATDKFAMVNGANGYVVACTTVGSTYTPGTALLMMSTSSGISQTDIVADGTDAFYARTNGQVRRATVSGTTITATGGAVSIPNDVSGQLAVRGGVCYEVHQNTTTPALSGLYRITHAAGTTTRQQVQSFTNSVVIGTQNSSGTRFLFIGSGATYHVDGMSDNFLGYLDAALNNGVEGRVNFKGIKGGLTNIVPGAKYSVNDGAYVLASTGAILGLSSTEVMVT
jgi:hypothetical protein